MYRRLAAGAAQVGGRPLLTDMFHGAEAYLEMWERAYGVPATALPARARRVCGAGGLGASAARRRQPGVSCTPAGQPAARPGARLPLLRDRGARAAPRRACSAPRAGSGWSPPAPRHARRRCGCVPGARARGSRGCGVRAALGHGLWLGRRLRGGARLLYRVRRGRDRLGRPSVAAADARVQRAAGVRGPTPGPPGCGPSAAGHARRRPLRRPGICDPCRHQQVVRTTRGSRFSLCRRSRDEPERFPRYPRLPRCPALPRLRAHPGAEAAAATAAAADPGRCRLEPS